MSTKHRPRRSMLYMPGSNARALEKGRGLDADALILEGPLAGGHLGFSEEQLERVEYPPADLLYSGTISSGTPIARTRPWSNQTTRWQSSRTASRPL